MTSGYDGIGWEGLAGAAVGARWPLPNPEGLPAGDARWVMDIRQGVEHLLRTRSGWVVVLPLGRGSTVPSDLSPEALAALDRAGLEAMPWIGSRTVSWLRLFGTRFSCRLVERDGRKEEWIVAEVVGHNHYDVSFVVVVDESPVVDISDTLEEQDRELAVVVEQFIQELHDNRGIVPDTWERLLDGLARLVIIQRTRDMISSSLVGSLLGLEPAMLMAARSPRSPVPEEEMMTRWGEVNLLLLAAFHDIVDMPDD